MRREVTIQLHCRNLPGAQFEHWSAIRLGVQERNAVVHDVPGDRESITFDIPLQAAYDPKSDRPNFTGPYAHGTPQERFIYLCWGERRNNKWEMIRRAKIMLDALSWPAVEHAISTKQPIEAELNMTDAKGGPLCARASKANISWRV